MCQITHKSKKYNSDVVSDIVVDDYFSFEEYSDPMCSCEECLKRQGVL